jgi:AAA+ superfamily predicted ATPase
MTRLLQAAFTEVADAAAVGKSREARAAVILLIDEADALAQSRELAQMHHEDRAGVNALVRGIDRLRRDSLPVIVIMCTNRLEALDPAIRRRAAATFSFERPDAHARMVVLGSLLEGADLTDDQLEALADATGPSRSALGCTFSDLTQRLVPDLVLDAFARDRPIEFARALDLAQAMKPSPTFVMQEGGT